MVNRWLSVAFISIGDWALKKRHRPLVVAAVTSFIMCLALLGVLSLMEWCFRRP